MSEYGRMEWYEYETEVHILGSCLNIGELNGRYEYETVGTYIGIVSEYRRISV